MKLDKIGNKSHLMAMVLVIFAVFVGLSCAAAADVSDANQPLEKNNILKMSVKYNAGTGYHWEVSPKTHGVTLISQKAVEDHPGTCGSSGTVYYKFLKQSPDYYVQLQLISPTGEVVKEVDSNMLN